MKGNKNKNRSCDRTSDRKLGFWGLTALIFGLMVGVGIFNLPQNMAATSSVGAVVVAWIISAAGILTLVYAFNVLSRRYPQFNAGIYEYAQEGFGGYAGFNAAWGYWLCTAFSNVAYAVMLNDAFGAFFPSLLEHGWKTVAFGSLLIWLMFFVVSRGLQIAKVVNTALAVVKVAVLIFIVAVFISEFNLDLMTIDFWGKDDAIGSVGLQIKDSMMVTLFCFFGVEGAVMMSARAKKVSDIGKAGFAGFSIAWVFYLLVSVVCFGIMTRTQLSVLPDPSVAYILKSTMGGWSYYFVVVSLIIALLGGWVAWTLVVAQVPYEASLVGIFPKSFQRTNCHGMPAFGLFASSVVMELFMLLVVMADNVYLAALHITGLMILPCYLFTALFLWKTAQTAKVRLVAILSTLFCCWMIYAGGLELMLMTSVFYLAGAWFYVLARKENTCGKSIPMIKKSEKWQFVMLVVASILSVLIFAIYGMPF